jgi:cbb3-type cytochrome oxidase subunit 3
VHENYLRLQALQQALNLPLASFLPCVAISGYNTLNIDAKDVVIDVQSVSNRILSQSRNLLSAEQLDAAVLRIQQLRLHPPLFGKSRRWKLLRLLLWLLFFVGIYFVYQAEIRHLYDAAKQAVQSEDALKTDQQRYEDRLLCSYSVDTGRCACYETDGEKANIAADRCKDLAERGSVLQQ